MLTGLDHVIIGVNNLESATAVFEQKLGLQASGGGIHPSGGTANRIIVIGDTYLELITVQKPDEAQKSILERLAKGDGYLNFVLASDDIHTDSARILQRGVSIIGPNPGELRAANGRSRGWWRTNIERPDLTQHYAFLIQHDSEGEERRHRLAGWSTPPAHPLGATNVLSTTIAVTDLSEAAQRFEHIYGLTPSLPFTEKIAGWEARLVSFSLGESGKTFELAAPLSFKTEGTFDGLLPEPGSLAGYLQTFGESLCRMSLAVHSLEEAKTYLNTQGVSYTSYEGSRPLVWIHPQQACGAAIVLYEED